MMLTVSTPLKYACSFLFLLSAGAAFAADSGYSFQDHPGEYLDVLRDGKIVARYMDAYDKSKPERRLETYKPFLHVFDPEGKAPITKGAGGDFTHHRGIFLGWNKIGVNGKTYDRWHMIKGEQVHEKFLAQTAGKDRASFTSLVKWTGEGDEPAIIEDERTFAFLPSPTPAYETIDVVSKMKALAGETKLDGDPEHSGLQFRPANEVDRKLTTYLFPQENANPHKDHDYPWMGETYTIDGKKYSVVYLNDPANPTGGFISAYRDYGRFGIFWRTTIPAGGTQVFHIRFLVAQGDMLPVETIQKAWNEFAGRNDPAPKTTVRPAEYGNSPDSKAKGDKKPAAPAAEPAAK